MSNVEDVCREAAHIVRKGNPRIVFGLVELLVYERNCLNTGLAVVERVSSGVILEAAHLHVEQARNYLEVVLYPVMNLLKEDLSFLQTSIQIVRANIRRFREF